MSRFADSRDALSVFLRIEQKAQQIGRGLEAKQGERLRSEGVVAKLGLDRLRDENGGEIGQGRPVCADLRRNVKELSACGSSGQRCSARLLYENGGARLRLVQEVCVP